MSNLNSNQRAAFYHKSWEDANLVLRAFFTSVRDRIESRQATASFLTERFLKISYYLGETFSPSTDYTSFYREEVCQSQSLLVINDLYVKAHELAIQFAREVNVVDESHPKFNPWYLKFVTMEHILQQAIFNLERETPGVGFPEDFLWIDDENMEAYSKFN